VGVWALPGEVGLTAMKVPGRKKVVSTAMIFMAELSCLLAAAISLESFARLMLILLSDWAIRLKSFSIVRQLNVLWKGE
jgi:hypothetical protein